MALVGGRFASVGAHTGFDGEHVLAKRFGLRIFAEQFPGVIASGHAEVLLKGTGSVARRAEIRERRSPIRTGGSGPLKLRYAADVDLVLMEPAILLVHPAVTKLGYGWQWSGYQPGSKNQG